MNHLIAAYFIANDQPDIGARGGPTQQIGTPQQVFNEPENIFVAGFIGSPQMNFFDGELN